MKKYFILFIGITSSLFAQETDDTDQSLLGGWSKYLTSTLTFNPPYVAIFTRIEGKTDNSAVTTSGIEWMAGTKSYYYGQLRYSYRMVGESVLAESVQDQLFPSKAGILHGAGGYLFDKRVDGLGWSMVLNGAVGLDVTIPKDSFNSGIANIFTVVAELNTYARYHFKERTAFQFGINIGVDIVLNQPSNKIYVQGIFRYGLGLGFAF